MCAKISCFDYFAKLPISIFVLKTIEKKLQDEVIEKIELFKNPENHQQLKVHKLHGQFKNCYSFSVNYKYRVLFSYVNATEVNILAVGDHDVYN